MKVQYTLEAKDDLNKILACIRERNPSRARNVGLGSGIFCKLAAWQKNKMRVCCARALILTWSTGPLRLMRPGSSTFGTRLAGLGRVRRTAASTVDTMDFASLAFARSGRRCR